MAMLKLLHKNTRKQLIQAYPNDKRLFPIRQSEFTDSHIKQQAIRETP